jgi:hypothetical protein
MKSVTSNIAGKYTAHFNQGFDTFSLPLEPFEHHELSWYQDNIPDCYYIKWIDTVSNNWIKHTKTDAEGMNDTTAEIGKGYELYLNQSGHYTFCGRPATTIRYIATKLSAPSEFKLNVVDNDVHLTWEPVAEADYYFIYRTNTRVGFSKPILTPYAQLDANAGTQFVDAGVVCGDCEYYYSIASVRTSELGDYALNVGYSICIKSTSYTSGYDSFALPLKPLTNYTASWYCTNLSGTLGVNWVDEYGSWLGHADWMPVGVYDTEIEIAKGYQICLENDVEVVYIGM